MSGAFQRTISIALRGGVAAFALALYIHGSTKRPAKIAVSPSATQSAASAEVSDDEIARGWRLVSVATNAAFTYAMPPEGKTCGKWHLRGAYEDVTVADFGDWRFPVGTNATSKMWAFVWGRMRPALRDRLHEIRAVDAPMSAIPSVSRLWTAATEEGARTVTWERFVLGRLRIGEPLTEERTVNAQVVLYPNGDFVTRSNEVERTFVRVEPFDWDGDGIPNEDDPHPRHNDGDRYGQTAERRAWVAARVGTERNGLYRLRAMFPANPPRRTLLTVGTNRVVVAAAGDYDFLLEKGEEYALSTEPFCAAVCYSADDGTGGVSAQSAAPPAAGQWSVAGGDLRLVNPTSAAPGRILWMPTLTATPGLAHLGPSAPAPVFTAVLSDCPNPDRSTFEWNSSLGAAALIPSTGPFSRFSVAALPAWAEFAVSVSATFGTNTLTSILNATCGMSATEPTPGLSLNLTGNTVFIRRDGGKMFSTRIAAMVSYSAGREGAKLSVLLPEGTNVVVRDESPIGPVVTEWGTELLPYESDVRTFWIEGLAPSGAVDNEWIETTLTIPDGEEKMSDRPFTVCEVGSKAEHKLPAPRNRTNVGVGEQVKLELNPELSDVTVCASNAVYDSSGQMLTVASTAGVSSMTVSRGNASIDLPLTVHEPKLILPTSICGVADGPLGTAGNFEAYITLSLLPTNVSFKNVELMEIGLAATNATGYFTGPPAESEWLTHVGHGADVWHGVAEEENKFCDIVAMPPLPREWGNGGGFTWPIPNVWRVKGETSVSNGIPHRPEYDQRFELEPNGTSRILKFGCLVEHCLTNYTYKTYLPGEMGWDD